MRKIALTIILICLTSLIFADFSGEYGFQMLKILTGASSAAQGGTGAFNSYDAFSFLENPTAGLINRKNVVSITQNYWIFDTKLNGIAYFKPKGNFALGFAFRQLNYGKIDETDESQTIIGEFHPLDLKITSNISFRFTPDHYFGANLYYLYEKINTSSSSGIAGDLGYTFITPIKELKFSALLKYFGTTSKLNAQAIKLPTTFEFLLSKKFLLEFAEISSEIKYIKHKDNNESNAAFGLNCFLFDMLNLRAGYKLNYDYEDLSLGLGVLYRRILIDYAFIPFQYEIDDVHMFSISYNF